MSQSKHNNQQPKSKDQRDRLNSYARFSSIATQMFAIIGIGTYAGVKLDEYYPNKHNLYTLVLSLLSVILSIVFVIKRIIAASKDE